MQNLTAGALSATWDGMSLRWLRWHGVELLRGVAFVVRDAQWGTYAPPVTVAAQHSGPDGHHLLLRASVAEGAAHLLCEVEIRLTATGARLRGQATAVGGFTTNRTGFVVLHGENCAGQDVAVEHVDGSRADGRFPALVSPHQPYFDLRALTHTPLPGLRVECRMSGDSFEMEDHRNWSDAGFKTYCRPLREPRPFVIRDGETLVQEVEIVVAAEGAAPPAPAGPAEVAIGPVRTLPAVWRVAPAPGDSADAVAVTGADQLATLAPDAGVVLLADAAQGALAAARASFPAARIAVGTVQNFAEFNRVPPPEGADAVFWGVTATIHATDDASVLETLRVLADQAATAAARHPGVPLWVGPIALRAGWQNDPRDAGPIGAAFLLGHIAAWTQAGAQAVLLPPATLAGKAALLDDLRDGGTAQVLAAPGLTGLRMAQATWLANLTHAPLTVRLDGAEVTLDACETRRMATA